ncbi:hypothetical protein IAT38_002578 [Cryptococcus sp. DSM 104549]
MLTNAFGFVGAVAGPSILGARGFSSTARRAARHVPSHYEALKLPHNATRQQVKAKFYELSKQYHPDAKTGDTAKFHEINDAYATLGDPTKRRQYDQSLAPASHSHHTRPHTQYNPSSTSSFTPNDPWLRRNSQGQGPHRAWRPPGAQSPPRSGDGPSYNPFGRRTPHGFRYTNSYDFSHHPNARRMDGGKKQMEQIKRDIERQHAEAGQGGVWKFVIMSLLVVSVIGFGGGLAADSQGEWVLGVPEPRPCRVLPRRYEEWAGATGEGDEGRRIGSGGES